MSLEVQERAKKAVKKGKNLKMHLEMPFLAATAYAGRSIDADCLVVVVVRHS